MGTREEILEAAARIMRTEGYARATTKEIARAAGYSEAALYKHFPDKTEIFLAVISENMPALGSTLDELERSAGRRTVRVNLIRLARTALDFYRESVSIAASLYSSQRLLEAHRARLIERGAGPHHPQDGLARYLRAEQKLGRVDRHVHPDAAALLLGACFQQAFLASFAAEPPTDAELDALATSLVHTLLTGA
ncbi:TetR/AcrR family transcriptional regulator [Amycolatopsis anabasis]|uniref:TetR/AcrR family transcriptional regulator n=1 Tax=Amycolatopsis anabasis TaxID=1840409 RepID=UPI00131BC6B6|nr:TetR/AcrR family transcriptional regulator [Amycolatopsis anabasis]